MTHLIATRRVFAPLENEALFGKAHVAEEGRAIRWSDEIDYCADALWLEHVSQHRKTAAAAE